MDFKYLGVTVVYSSGDSNVVYGKYEVVLMDGLYYAVRSKDIGKGVVFWWRLLRTDTRFILDVKEDD